jgi:glycerophosphoryl diester phosphodiesterase
LSGTSVTPRLVAHRGYMLRYPENTRPALQAALDVGADYIEFDLQMNADREFVLLHDDNFQRTAGVKQSVFSTDTRGCRTLSVHQSDRFGDAFHPTPVSTLAEILELNAQYPATTALVEIKSESIEHWGLVPVMDKLIQQLENYREQCVLISLSVDAIEYTQRHSGLKTGWVFNGYNNTNREQASQLQADYLITDYTTLGEGEPLWPEFKRWMLYDIVDPQRALDYGRKGVELIETADIGGLKKFFNSAPQ